MPYPYRIEEGRLRHPVRLWGDVGRPSNECVRRPLIANNYYCMIIHLECQQTFGNSVG